MGPPALIGFGVLRRLGIVVLLSLTPGLAWAQGETASPPGQEAEAQGRSEEDPGGDREPAPEASEPLHALRYHYANDTFTSTDYYFTQGMGFLYVSPLLQASPLAIPLPDLGGPREVSLRWTYEGFTPEEIDETAIQFGDRPFSSYMTLSHRNQVYTAEGASSLWVEWGLGYIGPAVGAREFQSEIHRHTGGKDPRGWRNQIRGDPLVQLELGYAQRLFRYESLVDGFAELRLRGGTLFSDATLGLKLRCGLLGAPLGPPRELRLYLWGALEARAVGYNATLEGGVFNDSRYTLAANDLARLVALAKWGAELEYGPFGLGFSFAFTSREFRRGRSHAWGQLNLSVFFG